MVEVLHPCKDGKYPFGQTKQNEHTYVEYLLIAKNEQEVNQFRQLNSIIKKIDNKNMIKLRKVLKQNQTFHMIYEFYSKTLQQRLKELKQQQQLAELFMELQNVFQALIKEKLIAELYLSSMGVDENNHLKVWIKPDQIDYIGSSKDSQKKTIKALLDYYETQRTRIHLQIQELFQVNDAKHNHSKKSLEQEKMSIKTADSKGKSPNFVIEGNTLVFLNKNVQGSKNSNNVESEEVYKQKPKSYNYSSQQRPISKIDNSKNLSVQGNATENTFADISKMSIAQKVLYYKKQKEMPNFGTQQIQNKLIIKDTSTSNISQNDLSKSSNNDSNMQIRTEMINRHKMKITTSQEVEIEGDSDDDLEKLAREKIAKNQKQRHQRSHTHSRQNHSTQNQQKAEYLVKSGDEEKFLKDLEEKVVEKKNPQANTQINNKILLAKEKARNILEKYGDKNKK